MRTINPVFQRLRTAFPPGWMAGILTFVLLFPAWWGGNQWYRQRLLTEQRAQLSDQLALSSNSLSAALNRRLALVDGLVAFVLSQDEGPDFQANYEIFARSIYQSAPGIRNIAVAPSGVINYVYPVVGNQRVIGYDPLSDPQPGVRLDILRAIDGRLQVLSGPIELPNGGSGLIARQAVYKENIYWGLVNLIFELDPLLERAGFAELEDEIEMALVNQHGELIFGRAEVLEGQPVRQSIGLPDSQWELAGVPRGGWFPPFRSDLRIFQSLTIISLVLFALLVGVSTGRQQSLALAVQTRTAELAKVNRHLEEDIVQRSVAENTLREREAQYRSIFNTVSDGIFINSLDGKLVDFNPTAAQMHGYTEAEFRDMQPADFIHPDSLPLFEEFIESAGRGEAFRCQAIDQRKDGTLFPVEVVGRLFTYQGRPHTLALVRDISAQVSSYQQLERRVAARTRELTALLDVSQTISSTLELLPLLDLVLTQLQSVVAYTGAALILKQDGQYQYRAYIGPAPRELVCAQTLPTDRPSGALLVLEKRGAVIFPELWEATPECEYLNSEPVLAEAFGYAHAWLGVPLIVRNRLLGVLRLDHATPGFFDEQLARLAQAFAQQAAIAIENAHLYEQAGRLAALQERQRLARELHDSVSQALYGIALGARTTRTLLDRPETLLAALQSPLDYVLTLAEAGLTEMRALIFELRPESLQTEGLVTALQHQAAALQARHQIQVTAEYSPEPDLPLAVKEALYRVAQEALHNVLKHSHASQVSLRLSQAESGYQLEVRDDGQGFDPQQEFAGHLGLHSMRERMNQIGGTLLISSQPGQGTQLLASFPVSGDSRADGA